MRAISIPIALCVLAGCGSPGSQPDQGDTSQSLFPHSPAAIRAMTVIDDADLAIRNEMDAGYAQMGNGQFDAATVRFSRAENMFILENPNFLPWIGKAEALCRAGRRSEGRAYATNFRCALEIGTGVTSCRKIESDPAAIRSLSLCYKAFCAAEIVRPQYEDVAPGTPPSREQSDLLELTRGINAVCAD